MKFLRRKRQARRVSARGRSMGFFSEEYDDDYIDVFPVGAATSDWGPSESEHQWPWSKKQAKPTKSAFGFSRALED